MTKTQASAHQRRASLSTSVVPLHERTAATRLVDLLERSSARKDFHVQVVDMAGGRTDLSEGLADMIAQIAALVAEGKHVRVLSDEDLLTTQEAADLLNVSRQYLVRLIDSGRLAAAKVGSHRRLYLADVLTFRAERDAGRIVALGELVALSEDVGAYDLQPVK
jgi:excisionase family DNA binding protein